MAELKQEYELEIPYIMAINLITYGTVTVNDIAHHLKEQHGGGILEYTAFTETYLKKVINGALANG